MKQLKDNICRQFKMPISLCLLAVSLVGCDGHHDPLDTSMKVGHVLCTDGQTRSYEDYAASGKEAIAVVFYVNHGEDTLTVFKRITNGFPIDFNSSTVRSSAWR